MSIRTDAYAVNPTIVLQTNSGDPALELRGLRRFADGSGFSSDLFVSCHGFTAQRPFYFSERSFHAAIEALRSMDEHLQGEARFEEEWERDQYLQFSMRPHGHVLVSGQLVLLDGGTNRLSFSFQTDQTCLAPFVSAFKSFSQQI